MTIGVERSGDERADARLEVAARDVHGAVDRALVELVRLAHVDEDGRLVGREARCGVGGADLVDLRLHLGEKILIARHVPANATCIAAIPSRLPCPREPPDRQEARRPGGGRGRDRARALPIARAPSRCAAPRRPRRRASSRRCAARRRSCSTCPRSRAGARRRSRRSPRTCARGAACRPRRRCAARARCSARATCASRSPARCCATGRARSTPRSACCARSTPTTTARPCPRCTSAWRCSGRGSAPTRRAQLQETRSLDPDGLYGQHGRRRPAPDLPQGRAALGALAPRARLARPAARAGGGGPALAGGAARLRLRPAVQLAHARAPRRGARARARREQHRRPGGGDRARLRQGRARRRPWAGWRSSCRAARTRPARASTSASCSPGSARTPRPRRSTGRPLQLDPTGLIGRFARSVLDASKLIATSREGDRAPSANLGGHEHNLLARGPGRTRPSCAR